MGKNRQQEGKKSEEKLNTKNVEKSAKTGEWQNKSTETEKISKKAREKKQQKSEKTIKKS